MTKCYANQQQCENDGINPICFIYKDIEKITVLCDNHAEELIKNYNAINEFKE